MNTSDLFLGLAMLCLISSCTSSTQHDAVNEADFTYDKIVPASFPDLNIPDFKFPVDSNELNQWIYDNELAKIYSHAWGIWAGLTTPTKQAVGGKKLLVYETWRTPEEMIRMIKKEPIHRSNRANLKKPHQFSHFHQSINEQIHESVAYSPSAEKHAVTNKLFMATSLYEYAQQNKTSIPNFPNDAITIKPIFKILQGSKSKQNKYAITTWHGTIDSLAGFPESEWHSAVYIDITNKSAGNGSQLHFSDNKKIPSPTPSTTYNLNDFIYYTLNKEDAYYFNKEFTENNSDPLNAKAGDIIVLVGMHVTTKENKRWTWQTFWWAPNADSPPTPSSRTIASLRPDALYGAASHYAMAVAYYMINPQEPYTGTNISGTPNYAWNPYLESEFGPNVFNDKTSFVQLDNGKEVPTYAGVRTNCMSCHAFATVAPKQLDSSSKSTTPYVGNSYVSLNDSLFKDQLKVDFLWSIEGNVDTSGLSALINKYSVKE